MEVVLSTYVSETQNRIQKVSYQELKTICFSLLVNTAIFFINIFYFYPFS